MVIEKLNQFTTSESLSDTDSRFSAIDHCVEESKASISSLSHGCDNIWFLLDET